MSEFYVAILARNAEGEMFATVPDLPGANSAAPTAGEALALVIEFANDYVADLVNDGHPIPSARNLDDVPTEEGEAGRALIPVDVPGRAVKISLSIDEALLARADRAAAAEGLTRSGFVAEAIGQRLRGRIQSAEHRVTRDAASGQLIPVYLSADPEGRLVAGVYPTRQSAESGRHS